MATFIKSLRSFILLVFVVSIVSTVAMFLYSSRTSKREIKEKGKPNVEKEIQGEQPSITSHPNIAASATSSPEEPSKQAIDEIQANLNSSNSEQTPLTAEVPLATDTDNDTNLLDERTKDHDVRQQNSSTFSEPNRKPTVASYGTNPTRHGEVALCPKISSKLGKSCFLLSFTAPEISAAFAEIKWKLKTLKNENNDYATSFEGNIFRL